MNLRQLVLYVADSAVIFCCHDSNVEKTVDAEVKLGFYDGSLRKQT